jgi:hypothetical protein
MYVHWSDRRKSSRKYPEPKKARTRRKKNEWATSLLLSHIMYVRRMRTPSGKKFVLEPFMCLPLFERTVSYEQTEDIKPWAYVNNIRIQKYRDRHAQHLM